MNTLCCFLEGLEADNWSVFSFREYFLILFIAVPDFSLISWLAKKSCFQRITAANGCGYVWASKVLIWNKTLHDLAVFFCHLKESSLQSQNASKTRLFSHSVSEWKFWCSRSQRLLFWSVAMRRANVVRRLFGHNDLGQECNHVWLNIKCHQVIMTEQTPFSETHLGWWIL